MNNPLPWVTVQQLASYLHGSGGPVQLVDVREPQELELVHLPGFIHLPLSAYPRWGGDIFTYLRPDQETWVLCHHGVRSAQMCHWLTQQGFTNVKNITGGIDAYALQVDPALPRY